MANLKQTRTEKETQTMVDDGVREGYPWGTQITLTGVELDKLGLGLLPIGASVAFKAQSVVTQAGKQAEPGAERRLELQITDMEIQPADAPTAADKLYGNMYKG